jgi:hypothetical protein
MTSRQLLDLADQAAGDLQFEEAADAPGDVVQGRAQCQLQAPVGTKLVHEHGHRAALGTFEEQRRTVRLAGAIRNLRHLQERVDLGTDARELAFAVQQADEGAQVHGHLRSGGLMADTCASPASASR